ncbi:hypothetical protein [Kitasatospora sp. A2-31]|uniref:hypothetical protein n=1 Tax=Kitasatospora sp. A2-31 TaxID=2916414 RepID=UPI001EEB322A|nr:hypothetical protein [Kitasatospora sp. A2-31]MCG6494454.1 hypothetical protein [Kitasatospora sp. A2-31]
MADDRIGPWRAAGDAGGAGGAHAGGPGTAAGAPGGPGAPAGGPGTEERTLRELMQRAVAEIEPDPSGLQRIRTAVPRRRAARRGALTGAAALALALAIALPALHDPDHLGLSGGPGSPTAHGGTAADHDDDGAGPGTAGGHGSSPHPGVSGTGTVGIPSGSASASPSPWASTTDAVPGATAPVTPSGAGSDGGPLVPLCIRGDLGRGASQVGAADGAGRIYGYFTVVNVSGRACRLGGPGSVTVTETAGTDPARIRVTDHVAGDPASGLPAPGPTSAAGDGGGAAVDGQGLLLVPRAGYRVDFGWVPDAAGCPSSAGASPSASPGVAGRSVAGNPGLAGGGADAGSAGTSSSARSGGPGSGSAAMAPAGGPSAGPTAGGGAGSGSPTARPTTVASPTATATAAPSTPPAAVTIAHTPAPGSPSAATATLLGACSGTVYRTGPQPLPPPTAATPSASPSGG